VPTPKRIDLKTELPDARVDELAGTLLDDSHFDQLIDSDAAVYRPAGELLLIYRAGVLPAGACRAAYDALRNAAAPSHNRGTAAGKIRRLSELDRQAGLLQKTVFHPIKRDGTLSNSIYGKKVNTGIIGYFDRYERFPYCRMTAFNLDHPDKFAAALPFIRSIDAAFRDNVPDRYAVQRAAIARTHPDFYIHGTVFSTITVNKNWQTAVHKDAGDFAAGFGVMTALRAGRYEGCYLVFPKFRVAVDMRTRGVLMADVHQWHGNTPLIGRAGKFERISCVFYYREKMGQCGSAEQELARAKARKPNAGSKS
jgi:hypothetical protein